MESLEERKSENGPDMSEVPQRSWLEIAEELSGRIENPVGPEGTAGGSPEVTEMYRQAWIVEAERILAPCDDKKARKIVEKVIKKYQK